MQIELIMPALHQAIVMDNHRFQVLNAGRRFGKSLILIGKIFKNLTRTFYNRNTGEPLPHRIGYYVPTYRQAKEIFWERAKSALEPITCGKISHSELKIHLPNGGEFALYGTDQEPDSLRGGYKTAVLMDEFAYHQPGVWASVIRPMLADTGGEACFVSTPKGYGEFFSLFEKGQSKDPDWMSWQYPSLAGGYISQEEIEAARRDMDESTWRQEFMAEFLGHVGLVCKSWSRANVEETQYRAELRLYVSCDFNVDPMCWVVGHRFNDEVHFIDELCIEHTNTMEAAEELARRYADHKAGLTITGDASGNNRSTKSQSPSATDFTILRNTLSQHGIPDVRVDIHSHNPPVKDRVAAWNTMVCSSAGVIRVRVSPRCKWLIWNCENLHYIEGSSAIWEPSQSERERNRDLKFVKHIFDAASYLVERYHPIRLNLPQDLQQQNRIISQKFRP